MRPELLATLLVLALGACATDSLRDTYSGLDGIEKQRFLAFYPEVPPDAKKSLALEATEPDALYRFVRRQATDEQHRITLTDDTRVQALIDEFKHGKGDHTRARLEIRKDGDGSDRIVSGDRVALHARLAYADGRIADATEDVIWTVQPALAWMEGSTLRLGCAASDVEVAADFLGEHQATLRLHLRKPLRSLSLELADADATAARAEFIRFKVIAQCEDGSSADVTCQADWALGPPTAGENPTGELTGCGELRRASSRVTHARVTASYGGLTVSRDLELPRAPGN